MEFLKIHAYTGGTVTTPDISIAILGCGHWGKNYVRNFLELPETTLSWVCDRAPERLRELSSKYPELKTTPDFATVLNDPGTDAVIISTEASRHFALSKEALLAGKDVLVEKPLALYVEEAEELKSIAETEGRILMVGHTFLYNPAINVMKSLIERGEVGEVYFAKAVRSHLGLIREDVNVAWDLASHDLSIFNFLLNSLPVSQQALGSTLFRKDREDVVFITLRYPQNILASIHVSWADTNKQRTVEVVGSRGRILFDDLNALEPLRLFRRGVGVDEELNRWGDHQYLLRDGDIWSPSIKMKEPLRVQCEHFVQCVRTRRAPITNAENGLGVVRTMVDVQKLLQAQRTSYLS